MSGVVLFKTLCIVVSKVINAPSGSGCGWSNAWAKEEKKEDKICRSSKENFKWGESLIYGVHLAQRRAKGRHFTQVPPVSNPNLNNVCFRV